MQARGDGGSDRAFSVEDQFEEPLVGADFLPGGALGKDHIVGAVKKSIFVVGAEDVVGSDSDVDGLRGSCWLWGDPYQILVVESFILFGVDCGASIASSPKVQNASPTAYIVVRLILVGLFRRLSLTCLLAYRLGGAGPSSRPPDVRPTA